MPVTIRFDNLYGTDKSGEKIPIQALVGGESTISYHAKSSEYGIGISILQSDYERFIRDYSKWKSIGVNRVRHAIYWTSIEPTKGNYIFTNTVERVKAIKDLGFKPYLTLAGGNSAYGVTDFPNETAVKYWAEAYSKMVENFVTNGLTGMEYEISNEPDSNGKDITPKEYAYGCKVIYESIKSVDPEAVVTVGVNTFLVNGWFLEAVSFGLLDNCDALSIHIYPGNLDSPEKIEDSYKVFHRILDSERFEKPIYISEIGYSEMPTSSVYPHNFSPEVRADYYRRAILTSYKNGFYRNILFTGYSGHTSQSDNEDYYGIIKRDGTETETFKALYQQYAELENFMYLGLYNQTKTSNILVFVNNQNGIVFYGWSELDEEYVENINLQPRYRVKLTKTPQWLDIFDNKVLENLIPQPEWTEEYGAVNRFGDFRRVVKSGTYYYNGRPANDPASSNRVNDYGILVVHRTRYYISQMLYSIGQDPVECYYTSGKIQDDGSIIWDKWNKVLSADVTILPGIKRNPPTDIYVKNGDYATIPVYAEGDNIKYQWYYSPKVAAGETPNFQRTGLDGSKTSELHFPAYTAYDGRMFCCTITDANGFNEVTSTVCTLHIIK